MAVFLSRLALTGICVHHVLSQSTETIARNDTSVGVSPWSFSDPPIRLGILANFPDPALFYDSHSSAWFLYGTNPNAGILPVIQAIPPSSNATSQQSHQQQQPSQGSQIPLNIQIASTSDFTTWTLHSNDALPVLGAWVASAPNSSTFNSLANPWSPDILQLPSNPSTYILYYAATASSYPSAHCIGAASASNPQGPFAPSLTPLICPGPSGGAIDPATFVDDVPSPQDPTNTPTPLYLLYKLDANSLGHGGACSNAVPPLLNTPLMLQRLTPSALAPAPDTTPSTLLNLSPSDGPTIEAPALLKVYPNISSSTSGSGPATYYLFYSSGCTRDASYDIKYATASAIAGPYTRRGVLLQTGNYGLVAPGSVSVRRVGGGGIGAAGEGYVLVFAARVGMRAGGWRAVFAVGLVVDGVGGVGVVGGLGGGG